jgi:hypothetical protein
MMINSSAEMTMQSLPLNQMMVKNLESELSTELRTLTYLSLTLSMKVKLLRLSLIGITAAEIL